MLVASDHFDESASVQRLSFASSFVEHVLRFWANDYKEVRHRKFGGVPFERPILRKQVASYIDLKRKIRVRAFRPTVPAAEIDPRSLWTIDFIEPVTPRRALRVLHEFRALLAVICGDLIDLWNVQLVHKREDDYIYSTVYFADPVKHPVNSNGFPQLPLLDIGHDRTLFRTVVAAWLAETPETKMVRGVFSAILQDKGTLRFSHLRDLVTIIETRETASGTAPLSKTQSCKLRAALNTTLKELAANEKDSDKWLETMEKRINQINYHDARIRIANFVAKLPAGFVFVPDGFINEVVELRNDLVHDIGRLKADAQHKLAFFVAKLKAWHVLSDAISLGARPEDIREGSQFFVAAKYMPKNFFTGDPSDDDNE